jgi:glycosyltransferase involved in cell wall biosynthesis
MRVALVHDWLTGMRGGERVLERLARFFPGAPIFTLLWNRGSVSAELESHPIQTSFLQQLPGVATRYRWFLPLFPRAIERFDFSGYDAVVSTSHAVAKGARQRPGTPHVCFVHTPMRYIWELEAQYFPRERFPGPLGAYVRFTCARLREWDVRTASRPTALVANSAFVAERIHRHWHRDARVVHPGVDVERFAAPEGERSYYLLAGAMAPYKRFDLAMRAFARLGRPLVVAGDGQDAPRLRALVGSKMELRGIDDDASLARLYAGAKALVFPGVEDFGIMPVEAMAAGCPVIALGKGGALETVGRGAGSLALAKVAAGGEARVPGGVLFGEQSVEGIERAVALFEREAFDPVDLRERAKPFAGARFDREMREVLTAAGIPPQA